MKKKILITGRLPEEIMTALAAKYEIISNDEDKPFPRHMLLSCIGDKDGFISMITDTVDEELLDKAAHLKMIAHFGVGYNNINVHAATTRGILVSNTPGVLTNATAELAFALILAISRRVVECDRIIREGSFQSGPPPFSRYDVTGKRLALSVWENGGKAVARRAKGFDMRFCITIAEGCDILERKELLRNMSV